MIPRPNSQPAIEPYYFQGLIVEPDCHLCPLREQKKVLPDGIYPAKICIVGEGPGAHEVRLGRGFVGPTGKAQWHMCWNGGSGFTRERVFCSNAALCQPTSVILPGGAFIREEEAKRMSIRACRRRLIGELLAVTQGNPDAVIVAVGKWAFQSLTGLWKAKITEYRGSVNNIDLQKLWEDLNR